MDYYEKYAKHLYFYIVFLFYILHKVFLRLGPRRDEIGFFSILTHDWVHFKAPRKFDYIPVRHHISTGLPEELVSTVWFFSYWPSPIFITTTAIDHTPKIGKNLKFSCSFFYSEEFYCLVIMTSWRLSKYNRNW